MAGGGADGDGFGQLGVTQPAVILQQSQHLEVSAVESGGHGRSSRSLALIWKKVDLLDARLQALRQLLRNI
jgi:hypothetical protein